MLDKLPTELQHLVIIELIDLETNRFAPHYPLNGFSNGAPSLKSLSQVNTCFRGLCEQYLWQRICVHQRDTDSAETELPFHLVTYLNCLPPRAVHHVWGVDVANTITHRHIRGPMATTYLSLIARLFNTLSHGSVKNLRLRLQFSDFEDEGLPEGWGESGPYLFVKKYYQELLSSVSKWSHLTTLSVTVCPFRSFDEDDIGRVVFQLPYLTRFSATGNLDAPADFVPPNQELGRALASRRYLKEVVLFELIGPNRQWSKFEWNCPLSSLSIYGCINLHNQDLLDLLSRLTKLKRIELTHQDLDAHIHPNTSEIDSFGLLNNFTLDSDKPLNPMIINILSLAPRLKKLHVHLDDVSSVIEAIRVSLHATRSETWSSLKVIVLPTLDPNNEKRIWLENWGKHKNLRIKFHAPPRTSTDMDMDEDEDEDVIMEHVVDPPLLDHGNGPQQIQHQHPAHVNPVHGAPDQVAPATDDLAQTGWEVAGSDVGDDGSNASDEGTTTSSHSSQRTDSEMSSGSDWACPIGLRGQ